MKSLFQFLLLFCCLTATTVQAQELVTTTIADETFKVSVFKQKLSTYSFLAGDTIIITITETEDKLLSKLIIEDVNSSFRRVAEKVATVQERIVVVTDTDFNLIIDNDASFKNPLGFNRNVHVNIVKEEYITPVVVEVNDFIETEEITLSDTTYEITQSDSAFAPVISEKVALGSKIEPGKRTRKTLEIPPVPGATYYVYWIGVGKNAISDYEQLKSKLPPAWTALGIIEPIDAYAMGKIRQMPVRPEGEDVFFAITSEENKNRFTAHKKFQTRYKKKGIVSYGIIDAAYVPEDGKTFICLGNDNEVSSINVVVKVVAVTINNTYDQIIKDTVITVSKVFRLNTEGMPIAEAKAALVKAEKELVAANIRAYQEHEQAQRSLDSTWAARQLELAQAQSNIDLSRESIGQQETKVNTVMQEQIQAKIKALDESNADSAVVAAIRLELVTVLAQLEKAKLDLKEIEKQQEQLTKLMQTNLKDVSMKKGEEALDKATKDAAGNIGKTVTDKIVEGVEIGKKALKTKKE